MTLFIIALLCLAVGCVGGVLLVIAVQRKPLNDYMIDMGIWVKNKTCPHCTGKLIFRTLFWPPGFKCEHCGHEWQEYETHRTHAEQMCASR
jgi:hypothetical protein